VYSAGVHLIKLLDIRKMPKLTDMQIRAWIKAGERFEGAMVTGFIFHTGKTTNPVWRFRYKFAGKARAMMIGSYAELSLSKARETAKSYRRVLRWVMTLPGRSRSGNPKHWRRWKQKKRHARFRACR
jgi:hypothetical protein